MVVLDDLIRERVRNVMPDVSAMMAIPHYRELAEACLRNGKTDGDAGVTEEYARTICNVPIPEKTMKDFTRHDVFIFRWDTRTYHINSTVHRTAIEKWLSHERTEAAISIVAWSVFVIMCAVATKLAPG